MFAWEAYEKGADVHLQADPTKLELLHKEYRVKKGDFEQDKKLSVLDKVSVKDTCLRQELNLFKNCSKIIQKAVGPLLSDQTQGNSKLPFYY